MRKKHNMITNLQYLQFMKEVAGCTSTSGGPHAARVFETAGVDELRGVFQTNINCK